MLRRLAYKFKSFFQLFIYHSLFAFLFWTMYLTQSKAGLCCYYISFCLTGFTPLFLQGHIFAGAKQWNCRAKSDLMLLPLQIRKNQQTLFLQRLQALQRSHEHRLRIAPRPSAFPFHLQRRSQLFLQ